MKLIPFVLATSLLASIGSSAVAAEMTMTHDHAAQGQTSSAEPLIQAQLIQAQGVVKSLDLANKKVTIAHEPIAALNWPAMTMRFTTEDVALIEALKPQQKVQFTFVQQGNISLLRSIEVVE